MRASQVQPLPMAALPTPGASHQTYSVRLRTGTLELRVRSGELPLEALCGFAARRNPRRGFFFVSRVLGRHIAVAPKVMRDVQLRLASRLSARVPGPVVFVGLAEAAVGLGRAVFEEWCAMSGREDALYMQTTRALSARPLAMAFEEPHSHAPQHRVYVPHAAEDQALLERARTLVLVDDEVTTGTTLVNLASAWTRRFTAIKSVQVMTITSWCGPPGDALRVHALLEGDFAFVAGRSVPPAPRAFGTEQPRDEILPRGGARFGVRPGKIALPKLPEVYPGERVLVLGTGEFLWEPFQVGLALEARGAIVGCQATSRAPALIDADLRSALVFEDNYEDGIPNYLYNVRAARDASAGQEPPTRVIDLPVWDRVILCHETPAATLSPHLIRALSAETLDLSDATSALPRSG